MWVLFMLVPPAISVVIHLLARPQVEGKFASLLKPSRLKFTIQVDEAGNPTAGLWAVTTSARVLVC